MKSKKKQNIVRVLFLLALFFVGNYYLANPINNKVNHETNSYTLTNVDILRSSGHWNLSPFVIDDSGGGDYTWEEASAETWCSGSGTLEEPYLIENVTIDGENSGNCITIKNSDKYFRIENCTVFNSGSGSYDAGIRLDQAGNGTLINNNCSFNNRYGIYIYDSDNNTVSGNTANNNQYYGIRISNSDNTTISGNTANNNQYSGIWIYLSDNNNVSGNTVNNNQYHGIYVHSSDNTTVLGNTANNNQNHGLLLYYSDNNTISGNIVDNNVNYGIDTRESDYNLIYENYFINNGIHALDEGYSNDWNSSIIGNYWDNYTGYDNDLDGIGDTSHNFGTGIDYLPIWNFQSPIHIDDSPESPIDWAWAETQPWCSGSGTFSDPYVIDGLNITARGVGNGILIENSNKYFIVQNCKLIESGSGDYDAGIRLDHVGTGTLINNNCTFNKFGINIIVSDNNTISGNTANNNNYGIHLYINSDNNTVLGNTANNNSYYGIILYYSDNTTVSGNTANNNQYCGIWIYLSNSTTVSGNTANNNQDTGIDFSHSDNTTVSGNTANNNQNYGIYISHSDNTTISGNIAYNNQDNGIRLYSSDCTTVSGNTANNNNYGIDISHSDNTTVSENTANNNRLSGINLYYSDNTTVSGNTANNNQSCGINLYHSNSTTISGNVVDNNVNYGIVVSSESDYNLIYKNYFNDNNYMNALDNGKNNKWDNGVIGNYWDDYDGVDANDDGIGDTPYIISGEAGSQDNFPIWADGDSIAPVITIVSPLPNSVFGLVAPNYNISIDELNLDTIWYSLNEGVTIYKITDLTGTFNQLAWEALSEGSLTIRFYANDTAGNIGFTDVEVIIEIPEDLDGVPIISFGNYYILFTFITITILSFIILEKRKKK